MPEDDPVNWHYVLAVFTLLAMLVLWLWEHVDVDD
jgi:hypothetical protein